MWVTLVVLEYLVFVEVLCLHCGTYSALDFARELNLN